MSTPPQVVHLRSEDILGISKNVIKPAGWSCEWNTAGIVQKPTPCKIVLASWNAYLEHLKEHCHAQRKEKKGFTCWLPRCVSQGISLSLYDDIVKHIVQTHMNRAGLPCPINGCNSPHFSRPAMLESHFVHDHPELLNQAIPVPSDLLLPSWQPLRPPLSVPTPLPDQIPPGCILLSAVKGTHRSKSPAALMRHDSLASVLSPPASPKKWAKLDTPGQPDEAPREVTSIVFDDMSIQVNNDTTYAGDVMLDSVVQLGRFSADLARPPKMLTPEQCVHNPPLVSIHYEVFARRLRMEEMEREAAEAAKPLAQTAGGSQRQVSKAADL